MKNLVKDLIQNDDNWRRVAGEELRKGSYKSSSDKDVGDKLAKDDGAREEGYKALIGAVTDGNVLSPADVTALERADKPTDSDKFKKLVGYIDSRGPKPDPAPPAPKDE